MNQWKETPNMNYYFRESDGRILGAAWHVALSTAFYTAKIYTESFPFTNECEKFLGHFINEGAAKRAVENYWLTKENLLEMK
jgi:hypothetical protein